MMFVIVRTFNTLYQFWIHTRAVPKLGFLEVVLNTPSHHRVHHGINPRYIDKNHAGILIIWDRLLGTFIEEDSSRSTERSNRSRALIPSGPTSRSLSVCGR